MPRYSHQMQLCISVVWHICYGAWKGQGKRLSVGEDLSWPRKYDAVPPLRRGDYLRPSMPESRTNYTLSHYITYSISTLQESVRKAYVTVLRPAGSPTPNAILQLAHDPAQSAPRARNQLTHRLRNAPTSPSSSTRHPRPQVQLRAPSPFLPPPLIAHQTHQVSSAIKRLLKVRKGIEHPHDVEDDSPEGPYFNFKIFIQAEQSDVQRTGRIYSMGKARSVNLATVSLPLLR